MARKLIKKYSNRRLYDTDQSSYITLEELAELIRAGHEVKVVDVKSGEDLTQATLAQIVVESRGAAKMLPVPLLTQMIRMGDDALVEFMSQYMSFALQMYVQAKQGLQGFHPYQFFGGGGFPFPPGQALAQFFGSRASWGSGDGREAAIRQHGGKEERLGEQTMERKEGAELKDLKEELLRLTQKIEELSERE